MLKPIWAWQSLDLIGLNKTHDIPLGNGHWQLQILEHAQFVTGDVLADGSRITDFYQ